MEQKNDETPTLGANSQDKEEPSKDNSDPKHGESPMDVDPEASSLTPEPFPQGDSQNKPAQKEPDGTKSAAGNQGAKPTTGLPIPGSKSGPATES